MSTEMIVDVVRRQFEVTDEALRAWRPADGEAAGRAAYTEDAIVVYLDRPSLMRRVVDEVYRARQAGRLTNPLRVWHGVSLLFDQLKRRATSFREMIASARQDGYAIDRAEEFERAVRELEELDEQLRQQFPVATDEEATEDRAAIARGDYQDADEAFARASGVDVDTWRKRMAEYERGRRG
jgi:hypothetical protein